MSNPANVLPPEYDDIQPRNYDPAFTADISTKMRVPDRLGGVNGYEQGNKPMDIPYSMVQSGGMNVPERILLAGQEAHIGMREGMRPDMDFASKITADTYVGLSTPPSKLTVDEIGFDQELAGDRVRKGGPSSSHGDSTQNGYIPATPPSSRSLEPWGTPGDGFIVRDSDDDEIAILQHQLAKITRHVMRLEDDNSKRAQREIVLYPLVVGYILFQVAKWFLRNS